MTEVGLRSLSLLNEVANALGSVALLPLQVLPAGIGAAAVAAVSGTLLLLAFKYTSHQTAIRRVRNGINADILALSLFKDSVVVSLGSQGRIIVGGLKLFVLALVPILCMLVPVTLLLGQLSLWWQHRPLRPGETVVVTLQLAPLTDDSDLDRVWPEILLEDHGAIENRLGPVRIQSRRAVCWKIEARQAGYHKLLFQVDGKDFPKEIAIGEGLMRVSRKRPGWSFTELISDPAEPPFQRDSPVQSIEIQYPRRTTWQTGGDQWAVYWLIESSVVAYLLRGFFKVHF